MIITRLLSILICVVLISGCELESKPTPPVEPEPLVKSVTVNPNKVGLAGTLSSGRFEWHETASPLLHHNKGWELRVNLHGQFIMTAKIRLDQEGSDIISALKDYAERRIAIGEYEISYISKDFRWQEEDKSN